MVVLCWFSGKASPDHNGGNEALGIDPEGFGVANEGFALPGVEQDPPTSGFKPEGEAVFGLAAIAGLIVDQDGDPGRSGCHLCGISFMIRKSGCSAGFRDQTRALARHPIDRPLPVRGLGGVW
jgi:hypothetical protein